jgi:hypothetical protein
MQETRPDPHAFALREVEGGDVLLLYAKKISGIILLLCSSAIE